MSDDFCDFVEDFRLWIQDMKDNEDFKKCMSFEYTELWEEIANEIRDYF